MQITRFVPSRAPWRSQHPSDVEPTCNFCSMAQIAGASPTMLRPCWTLSAMTQPIWKIHSPCIQTHSRWACKSYLNLGPNAKRTDWSQLGRSAQTSPPGLPAASGTWGCRMLTRISVVLRHPAMATWPQQPKGKLNHTFHQLHQLHLLQGSSAPSRLSAHQPNHSHSRSMITHTLGDLNCQHPTGRARMALPQPHCAAGLLLLSNIPYVMAPPGLLMRNVCDRGLVAAEVVVRSQTLVPVPQILALVAPTLLV